MMLQLKVTELGLDDSGQLKQINRVPGENDVRACVYTVCVVYACYVLWLCDNGKLYISVIHYKIIFIISIKQIFWFITNFSVY